MNISSGQRSVSVCCKPDTIHPSGAKCSWNVSFSTNDTIFPKVADPFWITKNNLLSMIPGPQIPCPKNTVCYADCQSENNISSYLYGNGTTSVNDSINGFLICSLDAKDYCFETNVTGGTKNVMSVCRTYFDFLVNSQLNREYIAARIPFSIYPMYISLLCLAITFLIYTIIPELKNLHGLILRTYMSCCFGHFLMRLIMFANLDMTCRPFLMISLNFAAMTTFFWLNVMSFDIWWTFRSLRNSSIQSSRKKYIIYSIYAWGMPMLMIAAGLIIDSLPNVPDGIIKPGFYKNCWGQGFAPRTVYYEGPMAFTMVCNICLFILTAINITRRKKDTAQDLEGSDSRQYNDDKIRYSRVRTLCAIGKMYEAIGYWLINYQVERFNIYLKLSIVMGMIWLDDLRLFFVKFDVPPYASFLLHFPRNIHGLIIFIVSVWNDKTKRLLAKHFGLKDRSAVQWIEQTASRVSSLARRPQVS